MRWCELYRHNALFASLLWARKAGRCVVSKPSFVSMKATMQTGFVIGLDSIQGYFFNCCCSEHDLSIYQAPQMSR